MVAPSDDRVERLVVGDRSLDEVVEVVDVVRPMVVDGVVDGPVVVGAVVDGPVVDGAVVAGAVVDGAGVVDGEVGVVGGVVVEGVVVEGVVVEGVVVEGVVVGGVVVGGAVVDGIAVVEVAVVGGEVDVDWVGTAPAVAGNRRSSPAVTMATRAARETRKATGGPRAVRRTAGPAGLKVVLYMSCGGGTSWRSDSGSPRRHHCRRFRTAAVVGSVEDGENLRCLSAAELIE